MDKTSQRGRLLEYLSTRPIIKKILNRISSGEKKMVVNSLSSPLKALLAALLAELTDRSVVMVCSSNQDAEDTGHDLSFFAGEERIAMLCEPPRHTHFAIHTDDEPKYWLLEGLGKLADQSGIAVATPELLKMEMPRREFISESKLLLRKGNRTDFEEFTKNLAFNGFERMDYVARQGEMAVRGGIVDIFPIGWDNPVRIDFWGNEIDSIREFDIHSQRSIREHEKVEFISKVLYDEENSEAGSLYDYLPEDTIFLIDSPEKIEQEYGEKVELPNYTQILINSIENADIRVRAEPQKSFDASVMKFVTELRRLAANDARIYLTAEGRSNLKRFRELVESALDEEPEEGDTLEILAGPEITYKSIKWISNSTSAGFGLPDSNVFLFTEHQLFDRIRSRGKSRGKKGAGISLKELRELKIGDYVVHDDKGIGRFDGFETVELGGSNQDCARIIYQGGDVLYVHLNYLHKVRQYVSQEGVMPKVNKLGSAEWKRKKARTKKRLKDIARDLIKLYAKRKAQPGFSFQPDTVWQKEFEASFIYDDTEDQASSTDDIKHDMESPTPMDRLVCGDVGYGKTEVAIRAAFKSVQAGKQVAVLVPTTILAQQHYMTFRDRLDRYPIVTEVLSRFRKKSEQTKILEKLKTGGADILIGTHRILSKDIDFKDLGLLIIDEEHRFGVSAKEKLRQLRASVDTLTLTATPIPRTLNFSLMGVRDMSIIATPPRNRIPVHTEILEWNNDKIMQSIEYELSRGGQVFFVSDKVADLDKIMMDLQMLLPKVRFAIAHGQMKSSQLESVMEKFIRGKYDVLVSTKIVESGLDIPNANTMIINRSNNFGLAELYQLRGRVGRTNKQAYCYLMIPPVSKISSRALKRLQAIEEFTDLGSGFQLAMRDMEIRGAGDMLGPEQSGFINDMGFELYHKILDEAVSELRTEEFSELFEDIVTERIPMLENEDISIEIDYDALLPQNYIKSDTERFTYYKRLYNAKNNDELEDIVAEIKDRYGRLPKEAEELLFVVRVRVAALNTAFTRVILKDKQLKAEFPLQSNAEYYEKAFPLLADYIGELSNSKIKQNGKKLILDVRLRSREQAIEILWRIKKALEMVEA